jgi:hypothetical protein
VVGHALPEGLPSGVEPEGVRFDVIDRATGKVLGRATVPYQHGIFDAMSPDSSAYALYSREGAVAVLGVGRHPGKLRTLSRGARSDSRMVNSANISFSPDGRSLLVVRTIQGEQSAQATVYDVASSRHRDLDVPVGVSGLIATWSPSGTVVAFAAPDLRANASSVMLVDARTGKTIDSTPAIENATFTAIAFARSGRRVMVVARLPNSPGSIGPNSHGSIRMWDANGLLPIGDPIPVDPHVQWLDMSRDGSTAATTQFDESSPNPGFWFPANISVFDLTPKVWLQNACAIAGRPFTRVEWKKLLPDRPYDPGCR